LAGEYHTCLRTVSQYPFSTELDVSDLPRSKTVRFEEDAGDSLSVSPSVSPGRDIETESLCALLQQAQTNRAKLQIVLENGKLWQKRSRSSDLRIQNQKDIPLKTLLVDKICRWNLRDKRILAVVLAHAVLHCSEGPWLKDNWSKEHVSFFKKDSKTEPDLSRPFLTIDFGESTLGKSDNDHLFMTHSYPALLALGILLLEIHLSVPIESRYAEEDLIDGQPNENTNLTTAVRLLQHSDGEVYEGYRDAVKACLNWNAASSEWADEEKRKRMYETIVEPLERELEHGFQMKPEDLCLVR
jgi:hypothetical protein